MATPKQIQEALIGYPRQLRWEDFKTVAELPEDQQEHDAGLSMDFRVTHYGILWQGGKALHKPQVTVYLKEAWCLERARGDKRLLQHEQGHFDITGLIARDLAANLLDLELDRKKLDAEMLAPSANPGGHQEKVQRVVKMWKAAMNKAVERAWRLVGQLNNSHISEGLYDFDTGHGLDLDMQKGWDGFLLHVRMHNLNFEKALKQRGWLDDPRPGDPPIPRHMHGGVR